MSYEAKKTIILMSVLLLLTWMGIRGPAFTSSAEASDTNRVGARLQVQALVEEYSELSIIFSKSDDQDDDKGSSRESNYLGSDKKDNNNAPPHLQARGHQRGINFTALDQAGSWEGDRDIHLLVKTNRRIRWALNVMATPMVSEDDELPNERIFIKQVQRCRRPNSRNRCEDYQSLGEEITLETGRGHIHGLDSTLKCNE